MRLILAALAALLVLCIPAPAQEGHRHHAQDMEAHKSFYWFLTRPDYPEPQRGSCCGDGDCYGTPARFTGERWQALRREDQAWIDIPPERVVTRPDELARRPTYEATLCATMYFTYCFVVPEGGT